ncbi:MAG: hypothetical protein LBE11_00715 [Prevotellaceae bacterium]|jgi:hypothetical protein|nr:hypothetical protein [Prevotellaceae bacterium]
MKKDLAKKERFEREIQIFEASENELQKNKSKITKILKNARIEQEKTLYATAIAAGIRPDQAKAIEEGNNVTLDIFLKYVEGLNLRVKISKKTIKN